ncbi:putative homogentisate 1,2-dioxygenase [Ilyonectria destructans]|nr:putative homogentisate 1,2-dioxygenase [Ilyonectria destructans]
MTGATAKSAFTTEPTPIDPHTYQPGFGNRFASEAVPNVLPRGMNAPQKVRYDLYSEQLNGSSFIAPRQQIQHVWMYRIRPSVAHGAVAASDVNSHLEACFSAANKNVEFVAAQEAWDPVPLLSEPDESVPESGTDFVQGIRTVAGQGDPTLREGIAIHVYAANVSMAKRAFCNNDGDLLILPQHGRLNIQTELGWLMRACDFAYCFQMGPVRGYIQEIFGTHYDLPDLGPVGSNGMALPRDFESPVASFDIDTEKSTWEIIYKLAGSLHRCSQHYTPFDVVAWHGNLVPYKYAIENSLISPILPCPLRQNGLTTKDTFRPPYYHRNMSTEIMGLIYGKYNGSSHVLEPGGLSYEASYMPHGETYETWKDATSRELKPERVCEDTIAFLFHISVPMFITKWGVPGRGGKSLHPSSPTQWDNAKAPFLDHLDEVNLDLEAAGLPLLGDASLS